MLKILAAILLFTVTACKPSKRFSLPVASGTGNAHAAFEWQERPDPVLPRGSASSWDGIDTLNPSVVRWQNRYWNLYSGFDGKTWHTGVAWSDDGGATWTRKQRILSPDPATWEGAYIAANGSAAVDGDQLLYWYQAGRTGAAPAIGLARSSDGFQWRKEPRPVVEPGPRGSWDERGAADPYVIRQGDWFYLYYTGMDRAQRQRLGLARSRDGVDWQKSLDNPLLDIGGHEAWDEGGLGEPAVWKSAQDGWYWMLYTGRAWDEKRRIGLAKSRDGVHWQKLANQVFTGASAWDSKVICDPTVEPNADGSVKVWFGGGDQAKPDERLNGQIGFALLRPATSNR